MNTRYFIPLLIILLMAFSFDAYSQPPRGGRKLGQQRQQKKERVKQLKIAYFTEELELTEDEAEKFWPVYNEMEQKMKDEKKKKNAATNAIKTGIDTLSDSEIETKMKEALDARIQEAEVQKEYLLKIGDVIGFKKAAKVVSLEAQFKRELVKRLSNDTDDNSSE
jgi:predicted signal transduction protein with EAL and GGDEF domain